MALAQQYFPQVNCSAQAIPYPTVFGAEFLSLQASLVHNYSAHIHEGYYFNHGSVNATNLNFCNVTVTYTHPGQDDRITAQVWLPTDTWNERMQAIGGGGWSAGLFSLSYIGMAGAVAEGYTTVSTDGGHSSADPRDWALLSPGNVDLYALQNFGSVSLNDLAIIGKSITESFYGRPPRYSYWSGCSQGGRQGYMLAQRYPKAFNGIAASAPAIYWPQFLVTDFWPQLVMNELEEYPHPCELDALTAAAIRACDGDDGLVDGLISDPDACQFDPYTLVGTTVNCTATEADLRISTAAAAVAKAAWTGAQTSNGSFLWYGPNHEAALTGELSLAVTECRPDGTCIGKPLNGSTDWIRLFVQKDPTFDVSSMTRRDFERIFHASVQQFASIIGTDDPNLAEFRDSGGKMLTYHGLADDIIPPRNTRHYYDAVAVRDPSVQSYYRLFEAPGLAHCFGGSGVYPSGLFDSLVEWVESGKAPDTFEASSFPDQNGVRKHRRILCAYPLEARYKGMGDSNSADSFYCAT